MTRTALLVALALGCGARTPRPVPPTCDRLPAVIDLAIAGTGGTGELAPAAAHALVADLRVAIVTRCTQDAWAPATIQCLVDAATADGLGVCDQRMSATQRTRFARAIEALVERAAAPSDAPIGIATCDAYIADVTRYAACPELPVETRDALAASLGSLRRGFAPLREPGLSDEARTAALRGCATAAAALRGQMTAAGCP